MPIWRPTIEGAENIPDSGPVIMASNHQAAAETYVVPCQIRREVHWLGKDALFKGKGPAGRFFAWLMRSVNVIPVDRSGTGKGRSALSAGISVLNDGKLLGVFPEGTRSPDGRLYKGKTGAVRLALATGAPIVPVAVINAFESRIEGSVLPRRSPRLHTVVGTPIDIRAELEGLRSTSGTPRAQDAPAGVGPHNPGGNPGEPSSWEGEADGVELHALTRILMRAIQDMSGQEYVDEYAADVKKRAKDENLTA